MCLIKRLIVLTVFTFATLSVGFASSMPYQWHQETGMHSGQVDSVDLRSRALVVGDVEFSLSPVVQVYSSGGGSATQLDLNAGRWIEFKTTESIPGSLGGGTVTEIWLK